MQITSISQLEKKHKTSGSNYNGNHQMLIKNLQPRKSFQKVETRNLDVEYLAFLKVGLVHLSRSLESGDGELSQNVK